MLTFISFILVFSLIVFIHEFGHFIAARLNGIFVKEFSIGMGPRLWSYQGKETLYSIKGFPIGGSVQMEGEEEASELPNSFSEKAPWRRLTVVAAGPFMNFVLALVILFFISLSIGYQTTTIGDFVLGLPAQSSGLEINDRIVSVNSIQINEWEDLTRAIALSGGGQVAIRVIRNEQALEFNMIPYFDEPSSRYMIGISPTLKKSAAHALKSAYTTTAELTRLILEFIPRLVTGKESMDQVAGPVGIAKVVGEAASMGIIPLMTFTAFISINLGIMNLLPIPALDGGRIIFITFEMLFKKKLNQRIEAGIHYLGFVLLITLMVFVLYNDVLNLFRG